MDYTRIVVDYLNGQKLGVTAYREVPADRPTSFIVVELTGCSAENPVQRSPSVDVDCWAQTQHDAEEAASKVASAMLAMPDALPNVFRVSVSTTYNNTDIDSGTPRYTVGCDLYTNE